MISLTQNGVFKRGGGETDLSSLIPLSAGREGKTGKGE
jgi:hypothetical protein